MTCNDKKLIDSPCLRTESYSGFSFGRMFSNKTGSLSAICNFNFNSLCCSHFLFPRSPSSVLGSRIPFALNVLSTNLLNTFLLILILTYLPTYLTTQPVTYLLTYFIHTHYSLNHSPIHLLLLTIESIIITVSIIERWSQWG